MSIENLLIGLVIVAVLGMLFPMTMEKIARM